MEKFENLEEALAEYPESKYRILTDEEADEACTLQIKDSVWSFNTSFLSGETNLDSDLFEAIQSNNKCENNNETILSLIKATCGLESLVESAISADGRGHFLSAYDFKEIKILIGEEVLFVYREN